MSKLTTICAWHQSDDDKAKHMGLIKITDDDWQYGYYGDEVVLHGICPECYLKASKEIAEIMAKRDRQHA